MGFALIGWERNLRNILREQQEITSKMFSINTSNRGNLNNFSLHLRIEIYIERYREISIERDIERVIGKRRTQMNSNDKTYLC
jgi:hypothetical protein